MLLFLSSCAHYYIIRDTDLKLIQEIERDIGYTKGYNEALKEQIEIDMQLLEIDKYFGMKNLLKEFFGVKEK